MTAVYYIHAVLGEWIGNCSTGVGAVWKELNHRDPALLENFEGFLSEVISELRQSDMERSTMQMHVRRYVWRGRGGCGENWVTVQDTGAAQSRSQ